MPMIRLRRDRYIASKHQLAQDLTKAVMRWEGVPRSPLFLDNTAAFITNCHRMRSRTRLETTLRASQVLNSINVSSRETARRGEGIDRVVSPRRPEIHRWPSGLGAHHRISGRRWGIQGQANTNADITALARAALAAP